MSRILILTPSFLFIGAAAVAQDNITGNCRTTTGHVASITPCSGSFCIVINTGDYVDKKVGTLSGAAGKFIGEITDPVSDRT